MNSLIECWCGCTQLDDFGPRYVRCDRCGTLVSRTPPDDDLTHVHDEHKDLYGREYWFSHQVADLQQPNLRTRARTDLSERCIAWLRNVLKYKLPPAAVYEIGSGHGGFVALLRWAGFDATGSELSPWVVDFAQTRFNVPIVNAALDDLEVPDQSQDAILLLDVLEHLRHPQASAQRCLKMLKHAGILVLQTPAFPDALSYEDLQRNGDRFLEMLLPEEHLYLFSRRAITQLLHEVGLVHVAFEQALFPYDMFLIASREPPTVHDRAAIDRALEVKSSGLLIQALVDLDDRLSTSERLRVESEADRAARLAIIEHQGHSVGELQAERNNLRATLATVEKHYAAAEVDRAARLAIIERQGNELGELQGERNILAATLKTLEAHYAAAELDRAARLEIMEKQGRQLAEVEAERNNLHTEVRDLQAQLDFVSHQLSELRARHGVAELTDRVDPRLEAPETLT